MIIQHKNLEYYPTKAELKRELPRKVMHQTFNIILAYLENSNKIIIDKKRIVWIFSPELKGKYVKLKG
ncbi:MAG: hypothetical protein J4473_00435 [Candidatus Aenigmarchaeota archaeon]|nr:hypothetical protein [Candidatus Aenigmarchaeota archaeon]